MKHERKEQLEANDLEVFLRVKLPKIWKKHGNTILMLFLVVCAAIAFWNYRQRQLKKLEGLTQNNLAIGWDSLRTLQRQFLVLEINDSMNANRLQLAQQTLETFNAVLSSDPKTPAKAWATLGQGEVFWLLANAPAQSLETSQPVVGPTTSTTEGYLEQAEAAYKQVLANYTDQSKAVVTSLFGLAAIEENRNAFDAAATWYDKVIDLTSATEAEKALARRRKVLLDEYKQPLIIKAATQPTSQPSTQPST